MRKVDRVKLPVKFSKEGLVRDLESLEKLEWIEHFVRQNYEGEWDVLPLRGPKGAEHPVMMAYSDPGCRQFEDTPFLAECPYFREVLESFPFELHSVRLMALSAGSRIKEHCDHDLSIEDGAVRLHIPVRTDERVKFILNGERVMMREGECWYLRLSDPHSVENGSDIRRVHLVVDAPVTPAVHAFMGTESVV
ncbi:aspartyl/asparaginyl beta-hydroxylase domain-containing protein [Rubritalea tangerina]|uniref:Aspartyl/asparaginyl beta-hydroxylase domain-containing protein n=1 Tax=Rubritalea tangerina TaxID=430798 RepID=A0ABW4ZFN2_9BACT